MVSAVSKTLAWPLIQLVRAYQVAISPWLGTRCRFQPTCSSYAMTALTRHGIWRGSWLSMRRIGRCHPWGGEGYDPVPDSSDKPIDTSHDR